MIETKKPPIILIIFSGLSFIPVLGIFFGLISIVIGSINYERFKLVFWLGLSGIMLTVIIYSILGFSFYSMKKSGTIDSAVESFTKTNIKSVHTEILNYKCKNGKYPDSLYQLRKDNAYVFINDPFSESKHNEFYYKIENDTFILFSIGKDRKPFTKDDIYPRIESNK
jgi:hypothetical protein